ncbi:MAG TPA: ABC transporter permease [Solirubrobacterales bacterium]|nr:ABC transporter permease [Solirubrobacterales bacterium]
MSDRAIVLAQARIAIRIALRTPRTVIFTIAFPLVLLVLFNSIFSKGGDETATLPNGLRLSAEAYFTAGIVAYAVALSTFTALAVSLTSQRESGQLKRYRGTPMPPWTFIAGQVIRATAQALAMAALLLAVGAAAYGVDVPLSSLPAFVLYVVLGTATLCALGIALSAFAPNPDAASTIAPFSVVMLSFVSGVWIPVDQLPHWLEEVGRLFPLFHLALGLQTALAPGAGGSGLEAGDLLVLAIWALVGFRVASRRFRWEPQVARG